MKLVHLSDLHLGKRVNEVSMIEDQKVILSQIMDIVSTEHPDAVLIAGDVYDKSVPSAEAVTLFDAFLCGLSQQKIPVLIISGNHDSPERLAFGGRLMEGAGIYISPVYDGQVRSLTLSDRYGEVCFWMLPFLKPAHVRRFFPDSKIDSYTDAIQTVIQSMDLDPNIRNVLLAHQFVSGATTCESEETSVGGLDNVDVSAFDGFDYVALGHLHGPQNVGSNRIRYCGTPLKYSFSESNHYKSVTVVELGQKGQLEVHTLPLHAAHDMRIIRGTFEEVTNKNNYASAGIDDYLHIILTDEDDVPEALGRLRVIYPNIMKLSYDNTRTRTDQIIDSAVDVQYKSPLELFEELFELQNNQPMNQIQRQFTQELIEAIQEGQA